MVQITLYGIPNCDTVKKARRWLDEQNIAYVFHNFKKEGVPEDGLTRWVESLGLESVVNRRGTTWRKLSDEQKALVETGSAEAHCLLMEESSMIKRPILESGAIILIGFNIEDWSKALKL